MLRYFWLLVLLTAQNLLAQGASFYKRLQEIDSLIQFDQFESALSKTNRLAWQYQNEGKKRHEQELLELEYRKAVIYSEDQTSPVGPLKILLAIKADAERLKLHSLACRIYLMIALTYERSGHIELTGSYLDKAYATYKAHNLHELYSTYCIRRSSYYRIVNKPDSLHYYARQAEHYAKKSGNERDLLDAYLLMGVYQSKKGDYEKALSYAKKILEHKKKHRQYQEIVYQYNNISLTFLRMKKYADALRYNDSAYTFQKTLDTDSGEYLPEIRYQIYDGLGSIDSAYYYFRQYHDSAQAKSFRDERLEIRRIEQQYENDKKEDTIRNKNRQMIFIGCLLVIIILASSLLLWKNRQVNRRNQIINLQVGELTKLLEQKKILLSELQHRVKNNLLHVVSILEIQKESADFNNIEELIRGNQNRIHSMALLHTKLNLADNVNDVDLKKYVTELADVVLESYSSQKRINISVNCEIEKMVIEKALPIGLILVELISNSVKHAFKSRNIGIINVELTKAEENYRLYYSDNGDGFDFYKESDRGLGLEITRGLIDQIGGIIKTNADHGFELLIYFK